MKTFILLFGLLSGVLFAQDFSIENFNEIATLENQISETSGLVHHNGALFTHNDSGGENSLYQLNAETGQIIRSITVNNAQNVDWEELSEDENHFYIGDFGNNHGNRTDLRIYKISKNDLDQSSVDAETISFTLSDQNQFNFSPNAHNYDLEAMMVVEGQIFLFSKNWLDQRTKLYQLNTTTGEQTAQLLGIFNVNGLITSATYNHENQSIVLVGYTPFLQPFLLYTNSFNPLSIINLNFNLIDLSKTPYALENGSQVEAVHVADNDKIYITRETFSNSTLGINLPAKLYAMDIKKEIAATEGEISVNLYPNPVVNNMVIDFGTEFSYKTYKAVIYNIIGEEVWNRTFTHSNGKVNVPLNNLSRGTYVFRMIDSKNNIVKQQKIIKS